jgi:hypothetical protein
MFKSEMAEVDHHKKMGSYVHIFLWICVKMSQGLILSDLSHLDK